MKSKLPGFGINIFSQISQLAEEYGAINLGQGFPDFPIPDILQDALIKALHSGKNQYAPMNGILPLRQQISRLIEKKYQVKRDCQSEIIVTSGATEAIFNSIFALVHPNDEVILLDPCYDCYAPAVHLAGGKVVYVPLNHKDFSLDFALIRAAITSRTRLICINTPHNPTASIIKQSDIDELIKIVSENETLYILSDEVYEHIIFDQKEHLSLLRYPQLIDKAVVVSSFGKSFHCTGWKIGYVVANAAISQEIRKIHQFNTFSTNTPAQFAISDALDDEYHLDNLANFYQEKRDFFRNLLQKSAFKLLNVAGSYFQVVDYSDISKDNDINFINWLCKEIGVAAIPLSVFFHQSPPEQRLIRFCFAKDEQTLEKAAERLLKLS